MRRLEEVIVSGREKQAKLEESLRLSHAEREKQTGEYQERLRVSEGRLTDLARGHAVLEHQVETLVTENRKLDVLVGASGSRIEQLFEENQVLLQNFNSEHSSLESLKSSESHLREQYCLLQKDCEEKTKILQVPSPPLYCNIVTAVSACPFLAVKLCYCSRWRSSIVVWWRDWTGPLAPHRRWRTVSTMLWTRPHNISMPVRRPRHLPPPTPVSPPVFKNNSPKSESTSRNSRKI